MIVLAFSGGVDSTVLLHQLAQSTARGQLRAIHVHHNLYPEADHWQAHCERMCAQLDIPLTCVRVDTKPEAGESVEAWAREQRLKIFKEHLQDNEILMTAQHADDQAETVLLALTRGSGPKGLSAMAAEKPFGRGTWVRPFLDKSKQALLDYALEHQLSWITDHSNQDTQFDRNYMREKILPDLKSRWPAVHETFSRSARHCAEQEQLLGILLKPIFAACAGSKPETLSIKCLLQQDPLVARALIRHWLDLKNFPMPGHKKFEKIFEDLIPARPDAQPVIIWGEVCIRRYRDDLYALRLDEIKPSKTGTKKTFQAEGIPPWERG